LDGLEEAALSVPGCRGADARYAHDLGT